jgi:DnaB-like helicase N terminal domain
MTTAEQVAVPPHNLEAEKSVVGAVLLDGLVVETCLMPEHFYRERHGGKLAAILRPCRARADMHPERRDRGHVPFGPCFRRPSTALGQVRLHADTGVAPGVPQSVGARSDV